MRGYMAGLIFLGRVVPVFARLALLSTLLPILLAPTQARAERRVIARRLPVTATRLQPIGTLPASASLNLVIGLPLRNQAGLNGLLRRIYDPASPSFHQYLTPQQF